MLFDDAQSYTAFKSSCAIAHIRFMVFSYRIINDWNGLPNSIGKVNTINTFKSLLEDHCKDADF